VSVRATLVNIDLQLQRGHFAYAETLVHSALEHCPANQALLDRLESIAKMLNQGEAACRFASGQLFSKPVNPANTLYATTQPKTVSCRNRFLLIKAWGYGFWADITYVIAQLCLAEMTDRIPIVHWGKNSLYTDSPGDDAFKQFFEPVSNFDIKSITDSNYSYFPDKWSSENLFDEDVNKYQGPHSKMPGIYYLGRDENVCVADHYTGLVNLLPWIEESSALAGLNQNQLSYYLYEKYLKPVPEVITTVDKFIQSSFGSDPFVAVHVRGSDKVVEESNNASTQEVTIHRLDEWLEKNGKTVKIFLMTDEVQVVQRFQNRYEDRVFFIDCVRTDSLRGVHYLKTKETRDRTALGREVMVDAYIASRAAYFIGNGFSNASCAVRYLKRWAPYSCKLLGGNALNHRIPKLYKP